MSATHRLLFEALVMRQLFIDSTLSQVHCPMHCPDLGRLILGVPWMA